jgi:hypothetical protein
MTASQCWFAPNTPDGANQLCWLFNIENDPLSDFVIVASAHSDMIEAQMPLTFV